MPLKTVDLDTAKLAAMANILRWIDREAWSTWGYPLACIKIAEQWQSRGYSATESVDLAHATIATFLKNH